MATLATMASVAASTTTATPHSITQMSSHGMPHGLGLLTTVASLPPKYRSRYLNIKTKSEIPLDLSVKPNSPVEAEIVSDVPIATTFTEVYTEPSSDALHTNDTFETHEVLTLVSADDVDVLQELSNNAAVTITQIAKPITPPLTPTKRKHTTLEVVPELAPQSSKTKTLPVLAQHKSDSHSNPTKLAKTVTHPTTKRDCTPARPIRVTDSAPKTIKAQPLATKPAKHKATRKLKFDEETSSPVSGTIIRPLEDITDGTMQYSNGDIDPKYNIVEITEETKAELAAIKNVIGDYICKLCRIKFDDAFGLARHRCACIVLLEYRCPECGKQFNCPANLASHRRWHKPKKTEANSGGSTSYSKKENRNTTNQSTTVTHLKRANVTEATTAALDKKMDAELPYSCEQCGKRFKRPAYLRKHLQTHLKQQKAVRQSTPTIGSATTTQVELQTLDDGGLSTASTAVVGGAGSSGSYQSYAGSSCTSSQHSYSGAREEANQYANADVHYEYASDEYNDEAKTMSECSNSSVGYGRLQIVESGLTEEENIAATALTNLRNCASVIQHTTLAH